MIAATAAILGIATLGVALGHYATNPYFGGRSAYSAPIEDEDWWTTMEEHMRYRLGDAFDEEWFDEMKVYMEEHFEEVQEQKWFAEMRQYMEERWQSRDYEHRYGGYQRGYGRGCWGW